VKYVICMPGIPRTGEPPSFKLSGSLMPLGSNYAILWMSPDHPSWCNTDLLKFDRQEDADKWLIEFLLERPPVTPEEGEYDVDPIVVGEEALMNWQPYCG
jgi:hypothetical protein